jgi:hypothetical protein
MFFAFLLVFLALVSYIFMQAFYPGYVYNPFRTDKQNQCSKRYWIYSDSCEYYNYQLNKHEISYEFYSARARECISIMQSARAVLDKYATGKIES